MFIKINKEISEQTIKYILGAIGLPVRFTKYVAINGVVPPKTAKPSPNPNDNPLMRTLVGKCSNIVAAKGPTIIE